MSKDTAEWLIRQREERGWSRPQMARELIKAAQAMDYKQLPDPASLRHNIYRWEHGTGVSHEYVTMYCKALGIHFSGFPRQDRARSKPKAGVALAARDNAHLPGQGRMTYRGNQMPGTGVPGIEHEVMMTAHESSDHAAEHERHGIGDTTLEQLRADVMRLSRLTDSDSPFPVFTDLRRVRDRIHRILDQRLWPREQADLYFLLGCVNGLMGVNANRLGYPDAAEELLRAGYAYASAIGHNALRGMLRVKLSFVMYHRGWYAESRDFAADGLRYVWQGQPGADLHLNHARAAARTGDLDAARESVRLAHAAMDADYSDDLTGIGGAQFTFSRAGLYSLAGDAFVWTEGSEGDGVTELEQAISLFDQGPGPGEQHSFLGRPLAGTRLAMARLRSGELDGAAVALTPVLALPAAQRVSSVTTYLRQVRDELAAPAFRESPQARDLGDRIEDFSREAVTASLRSLSG
jgi:hypothetical protein